MQQIELWVRDDNILDMKFLQFDQNDILRFCRARKFDIPKIKIMVSEFAQWRQDQSIDTLYETWEFPEMAALKAALPNGLHKQNKQGNPIFIRRVGMVNFDAFFAAATPERIVT